MDTAGREGGRDGEGEKRKKGDVGGGKEKETLRGGDAVSLVSLNSNYFSHA